MKKLLALAAIAAFTITLFGCTSVRNNVPATEIKGTICNQPYSLILPKDTKADEISVTVAATNNVKLLIKNLVTTMNPDVISMTGEAYAKMRTADAAYTTGVINSASAAVGTIGGTAAKTAVKP